MIAVAVTQRHLCILDLSFARGTTQLHDRLDHLEHAVHPAIHAAQVAAVGVGWQIAAGQCMPRLLRQGRRPGDLAAFKSD